MESELVRKGLDLAFGHCCWRDPGDLSLNVSRSTGRAGGDGAATEVRSIWSKTPVAGALGDEWEWLVPVHVRDWLQK